MASCQVGGCARDAYKRGFCNTHYIRQRRYGDPTIVKAQRYGETSTCEAPGCDIRPIAAGRCKLHYERHRNTGEFNAPMRQRRIDTPRSPVLPWPDRFWAKVQPQKDGCWLWTGSLTKRAPEGYGSLKHERRRLVAHRVAYELMVGPIPDDLELDHLCRVRQCVNPNHLEPVGHRENVRRGVSIPAQCAKQTHCSQGHEFTAVNTYVQRNGSRRCRTCKRDSANRRNHDRRERTGRCHPVRPDRVFPGKVRAWGKASGFDVADTGRLSQAVTSAYLDATGIVGCTTSPCCESR